MSLSNKALSAIRDIMPDAYEAFSLELNNLEVTTVLLTSLCQMF